jgi:hypothetical protein
MASGTTNPSRSSITVGDDKREIQTWHDEHFAKLRKMCGVEPDFLVDQFSNKDFKSGGGKGGDLMAFTRNRQYIVKELNAGDHATLLKVTPRYERHVTTGPTLLCVFLMHYRDVASGKPFIVMGNCLLTTPGFGAFDEMLDLKGCAGDKRMEVNGHKIEAVHKRFCNVQMWLGRRFWSEAREAYLEHKTAARKWSVALPKDIQEQIAAAISRDCSEFLIPEALMDYSLIVGRKSIKHPGGAVLEEVKSKPKTQLANWRSPFLFPTGDGKAEYISMGIIDFLQVWNAAKVVAMVVKFLKTDKATVPPRAYGKRFIQQLNRLKPLPPPPSATSTIAPSTAYPTTTASIAPTTTASTAPTTTCSTAPATTPRKSPPAPSTAPSQTPAVAHKKAARSPHRATGIWAAAGWSLCFRGCLVAQRA